MSFIESLLFFAHNTLHITRWQDIAEILLITSSVYMFTRWLNKDTNKRPLFIVYGYTAITCITFYMGLERAAIFLLAALPIMLTIVILVHQEILQKNFIVHRTLDVPRTTSDMWLDELMRAGLTALNKHHQVLYLIERQDQLMPLLHAQQQLNMPITKALLELIMQQPQGASFIWVNHAGNLVALQARMQETPQESWISEEVQKLPHWKQDAILITSKSDALVICFDQQKRLCECIIDGKILSELSAHQTLQLIKRHISATQENSHAHTHHGFASDHSEPISA